MDEIVAFDNIKTKVLKYILYKKRTEAEVRKKFETSCDENLLEDVIEYLKQAGYINDKDYIQRAVNEYMNLRNLSLKEISYKLMNKGMQRHIIEDYFSMQQDALYEYEKNAAKNIVIKKMGTMDLKEIVVLLKKKGYNEESIAFATKDYEE